jgi:hypothetical protein
MTDSVEHPYVEWIAREAKRPVVVNPAARDRVMAAVRAEGPIRPSWFARRSSPVARRAVQLSPITSTLIAAGLVGIGVLAGGTIKNWGVRKDGQPTAGVAAQPPVSHATDTVVKFVFVNPEASKVTLVGDFNDWDVAKTPMVRSATGGLWTVTLPLKAGRHLYAFVVDGSTWSNDPGAPVAPDDGFGHTNSIRNVPGPAL